MTEDAFGEFEKTSWNAGRAEPYHEGIGRITKRAIDPLLEAAGVGPGTRLLDLATGPGYVAARGAERGAEPVGMDFAPEMLELARRLHPELEFQQGDANALPFEAESFDVVVANFLMPHLTDLPGAVREAARVTRPGGRVALTTWDSPQRTRFVGAVMDAVTGAGATMPEELPAGPSLFQYSPDRDFARLLLESGLSEPIVERIAFEDPVDDLDRVWDVCRMRFSAAPSARPCWSRASHRRPGPRSGAAGRSCSSPTGARAAGTSRARSSSGRPRSPPSRFAEGV